MRRPTDMFLAAVLLLLAVSAGRSGEPAPAREREICAPARVFLRDGAVFRADRLVVAGDSLRTFNLLEMRLSLPHRDPDAGRPAPVPVRRTFPLDRVSHVVCNDPLGNGALIGFFAGGVPFAIAAGIAVAGSEADVSFLSILGGAGLGMGIGGIVGGITGAIVDAAFSRRLERHDLREAPPD